jgi:hypothetical protein
MHALPILAATKVATFWSAMPHLLGMLMVMLSLAILWWVCSLTALLVRIFITAKGKTDSPQPEESSAIPPEMLAVITAAANSAIGRDYKTVSIKSQDSNWERAGRQSVLTSHKIR